MIKNAKLYFLKSCRWNVTSVNHSTFKLNGFIHCSPLLEQVYSSLCEKQVLERAQRRKGPGAQVFEEWLRELGLFSWEKRRLRVDLNALYNCLKGGCSKLRVGLCSLGQWYRMSGDSLKLHQWRYRLDIRKNFFSERVLRYWYRLPREVVMSPSLEVFKECVDIALKNIVQWAFWWWVVVELGDLRDLLH